MFIFAVPLCRNLVEFMNADVETKILWTTLRPVVLGRIPYAPDTPAVREIIKHVSRLNSDVETKILWTTLRPVVLGRIPYAPDTPAVREIIKQVRLLYTDEILWTTLRPVVLGRIPYAPDTPAVREIIINVRLLMRFPLITSSYEKKTDKIISLERYTVYSFKFAQSYFRPIEI